EAKGALHVVADERLFETDAAGRELDQEALRAFIDMGETARQWPACPNYAAGNVGESPVNLLDDAPPGGHRPRIHAQHPHRTPTASAENGKLRTGNEEFRTGKSPMFHP